MADPSGKQQPIFTQAEIRFVRSTLRRLGVRHGLDDAVGDVLLAVSEHLPGYSPSRPIWPWLYTFARFGSLNHLHQTRARARRELGVPDVEALNLPHGAPDPWASAVTRNRLEILDRLLSALPPEQVEVLLLHDLPYRESLRIEALANLGRLPEARRRLLQLRKATPADPLLLRLDRLLRAPP